MCLPKGHPLLLPRDGIAAQNVYRIGPVSLDTLASDVLNKLAIFHARLTAPALLPPRSARLSAWRREWLRAAAHVVPT